MNHFLFLPVILTCLLGMTYFLPGQGNLKDSAISTELPERLNGWKGTPLQASIEEKNTLSKDTVFRKMDYWRLGDPRNHYSHVPNNQKVHLSVVFSGHDVNNSIHRPERCMPAQGHYNMTSKDLNISIPERGFSVLVKRLSSKQKINLGTHKKSKSEANYELDSLTYYIFIGHKALTQDHLGRTFFDIKDRLLGGYDQRWAFVSMSLPYGPHPFPYIEEISEKEADDILTQLMSQLLIENVDLNNIEFGIRPIKSL